MVRCYNFYTYLHSLNVLRSALSVEERITYTDAALCLQRLPPKSDLAVVSGARSRYDDFVAVHINMTLSIHATVSVVKIRPGMFVHEFEELTYSRPIF